MHLNREDSERLLGISTRTYDWDKGGWDPLTGPEKALGLLSQSWGESFGYACCDPESYVPRLCQLLFQPKFGAYNGNDFNFIFVAAALAKLVDRTAIPIELAEQLTATAAEELQQWYDCEGEGFPFLRRSNNLFGSSACKLLGLLGGVQHEKILIRASKLADAATALHLIHGRMARQMTGADSVQPKPLCLATPMEDDALLAHGNNEMTDPVQEEQADLVRAIVNSKLDMSEKCHEVGPMSSSGDVHSEASFLSAPTDDERCFLKGTMLLGADGRPVLVQELRQHDLVLASNGEMVQILRVMCHPGPHKVVTLQDGDVYLRMTASHRVVVQRGNKHEPAPAKNLRAGEDIVCRLGVRRLVAEPVVTEEDVEAFELIFKPNLAVETFPGVPGNAVLTMGSRPTKCRSRRSAMPELDTLSIPPTDDGFDDHAQQLNV